jgi:hypothetical protein
MKFSAPTMMKEMPKTARSALKKGPIVFPPVIFPPFLSLSLKPDGMFYGEFDQEFYDLSERKITYSIAFADAYDQGNYARATEIIETLVTTALRLEDEYRRPCEEWYEFNRVTIRILNQEHTGCDEDYSKLKKDRDREVGSACDVNLAVLQILQARYKDAIENLHLCPFENILQQVETSSSESQSINENSLLEDDMFPEDEDDILEEWPIDRVAMMASNYAFMLFHGLGIKSDEPAAGNLFQRVRPHLPQKICVMPPIKRTIPVEVRKRALDKAWDEVESGSQIQSLWKKLWMKNKGDDAKTKYDYIEARIKQISKSDDD